MDVCQMKQKNKLREELFLKLPIHRFMAKVNQELPNGSVTDETGNRSIGTCVFTFKLDLHT